MVHWSKVSMTYPTNSIPTNNPQNLVLATPIGLQTTTRDPTPQDDTFIPGTEWQNTTTGSFFKCISSTISGAVWQKFVSSVSGPILTVTGDTGGAVDPDILGNLNVIGGDNISTVGTPLTNTLTIAVSGTTDHALQLGNAVGSLSSLLLTNGQLPIGSTGSDPVAAQLQAGSNITITNGPGTITIAAPTASTLPLPTAFYAYLSAAQPMATGDNTLYTIPYNSTIYNQNGGFVGFSNSFVAPQTGYFSFSSAVTFTDLEATHTDVEVYLNVTGTSAGLYLMAKADPAEERNNLNVLTLNSSIQIEMTSGDSAQIQVRVGPVGQPKVVGIDGGSATLSGYWAGSIIFSSNQSSVSWQIISTNQTIGNFQGYFVVAPGGNVLLTLPLVSVVGDTIEVSLSGATSWEILEQAGQQIRVGNLLSTVTTGSVKSTLQGDSIRLVCRTASPGSFWQAVSFVGNLLVT
jgi:hypothetical protein